MRFSSACAVRVLLVVAFVQTLLISSASASTVLPMSLGDMVRESDAIVVASVGTARARWLDDRRHVIVTDCDVLVEEVVAGRAPERTTLTFWGGSIGTETQEIAGMPIPDAGDRFVMFLRPGALSGQVAPTVGLHLGLLRVA